MLRFLLVLIVLFALAPIADAKFTDRSCRSCTPATCADCVPLNVPEVNSVYAPKCNGDCTACPYRELCPQVKQPQKAVRVAPARQPLRRLFQGWRERRQSRGLFRRSRGGCR